ncbi:HindVP family restriction endonuclease [Helicobacter gastrocanis]|uniref:HindVP family restriction endonuclease n=1 Tax=Helicobacter gastrocanis TaxID=2849641 RepID=UPI001C847442
MQNSNRDFSQKQAWGKNQFNTAFPASLCCYFEHHNIKATHLRITEGTFAHAEKAQVLPHISSMLAFLRDIYNAIEHTQSLFYSSPLGRL